MIYYQDNFLPEDQFLALKNRVEKRFIAKGETESNSTV